MNALIYAKFSPERRDEYRLVTEILENGAGDPCVRKRAFCETGQRHLEAIPGKQRFLEGLYGDQFQINRCTLCEDGSLDLAYVAGPSLESILDDTLQTGGPDAAVQLLKEQMERLIPGEKLEPFRLTEDFTWWFGEPERLPEDWLSLPVSDLDMIPSNLICLEDRQVLLDYEWTFDFPVPADYLRYRIIFYYFFRHAAGLQITDRASFYAQFGIRPGELPFWQRMEENFQKRILKEAAGNENPEQGEETAAETVIGPMQGRGDLLQIYWNQGNGWAEENSVLFAMRERSAVIRTEIPSGTIRLRIDPGDIPCICQLEELSVREGDRAVPFELAVNGVLLHKDKILFFREDPQIHIIFPFGETEGDSGDSAEGKAAAGTKPGTTLELRLRTWGTAEEILQEAEDQIRDMKARIDGIEASRAYRLYRMLKGKPKE